MYIIYRLNTRYNPSPLGGCVSSLGATQGCVCIQLHSKEHTLLLQEHTPAGDTAWGLCHLHGHCGLCDAVQAQALWFMVLSAREGKSHGHISSHSGSHFFHVCTQLVPGAGRDLHTHTANVIWKEIVAFNNGCNSSMHLMRCI